MFAFAWPKSSSLAKCRYNGGRQRLVASCGSSRNSDRHSRVSSSCRVSARNDRVASIEATESTQRAMLTALRNCAEMLVFASICQIACRHQVLAPSTHIGSDVVLNRSKSLRPKVGDCESPPKRALA